MLESDKPPQPADRCRLTILDLLLLMFSYALGFGVSRWLIEHGTPGANASPPWGGPGATTVVLVLGGFVLGSAVAAPVTLITQRLVRRRKLKLSAGEWLWIVATLNCLVLAVVTLYLERLPGWPIRVVGQVAACVQCGCVFLGAVCLYKRLRGNWDGVECRWTELFGCLIVPILFLLALYAAAVSPIL